MKPGVKSTEFWMTAVAQLLPFLVLLGVVPAADVQPLTTAIASVVSGCVAGVSLIAYIVQRYKLKTQPSGPAPQVQPMRGPMTLPGEGCDQPSEELERLKAAKAKIWAKKHEKPVAEFYPNDCDADS